MAHLGSYGKNLKSSSLSVKQGSKKFKTDFGAPTGQNPVHKINKWPHVRVATQSTMVK